MFTLCSDRCNLRKDWGEGGEASIVKALYNQNDTENQNEIAKGIRGNETVYNTCSHLVISCSEKRCQP